MVLTTIPQIKSEPQGSLHAGPEFILPENGVHWLHCYGEGGGKLIFSRQCVVFILGCPELICGAAHHSADSIR